MVGARRFSIVTPRGAVHNLAIRSDERCRFQPVVE